MSCTFYSFKGGLFGGDYWCDKKDCRVDNDTYRRYCRIIIIVIVLFLEKMKVVVVL